MHTRYVCFFFIHLNKIPYSYIVKCESLISCNNLKTHEDVTSLNDSWQMGYFKHTFSRKVYIRFIIVYKSY